MGRHSRWPLTESALKIDIRELGNAHGNQHRGVFSAGLQGAGITLGYPASGAELRLDFSFGQTYSSMRLRYHTDDLGSRAEWIRTPETINETIALLRFPQPFGGHRWYFVCPTANKRCQVLYLPHGASRFRSRWGFRCPRLQYQSQRLSRPWRLKYRAEQLGKLVTRQGPPEFRQAYADYAFPPKPPWMRWKTYNRLDELAEAYDNAGEAVLNERLFRWARRLGMKGVDDLYAYASGEKT